jgi:hypothetical protein
MKEKLEWGDEREIGENLLCCRRKDEITFEVFLVLCET